MVEQRKDGRGLRAILCLLASAAGSSPAPAQAADVPSAATPPAFYVSPGGCDEHDGGFARPFATLTRALTAMQGSHTHLTLVEGGRYTVSATIVLGPRAAGVSLVAYPGQHPVLDAQGAALGAILALDRANGVTIAGLGFTATAPGTAALRLSASNHAAIIANRFTQVGTGISLSNSSDSLISGNLIENAAHTGIEAADGSDRNRFDSNLVDGAGGPETHGGGIMLHGATGDSVTHNLIQNTGGLGIGVLNWDDATINRDTLVAFNIVRDVDRSATDSGAIYVLGRSRADTRMVIAGNLVDGSGRADQHSVGIYLDDSTNGVSVAGNIVRNAGSDALQIHGGSNDRLVGNIFDLGAGTASAVLFQAAPADTHPDNAQAGNLVRGNIIASSRKTGKIFVWLDGGKPEISGNLYYDALGGAMAMPAQAADTAPRTGDPRFADAAHGDYTPLPGSAAAAIGFDVIDGGSMGLHPLTAHAY